MPDLVTVADCREWLPRIAGLGADAIVTDPPYELGFMGKRWDGSGVAYDVDLWRAALAAVKPGAHLVAFGGTRTYHRMACAIEDAGWVIRDSLCWLYGSGFPKSLDVSKALDKRAGAVREVVGVKRGTRGADGTGHESAMPGKAAGIKQCACNVPITAPATDLARQWSGYGTALKPAHEPVVLARKPLDGTVAANVERHGCGALNVDGCRVGVGNKVPGGGRSRRGHGLVYGNGIAPTGAQPHAAGRWPANVVLDEEAGAMLDEQSGESLSRGGSRGAGGQNGRLGPIGAQPDVRPGIGDSGGASRFFYCAKASRKERELGLVAPDGKRANGHPTVKPLSLMRWLVRLVTPPGGLVIDPFTGSGTTGMACAAEGMRFLGCEQSEEYAAIARQRIAAVEPPEPTLFDEVVNG
jgi:site-specific DNA-methyltransferase (adenine-specific)